MGADGLVTWIGTSYSAAPLLGDRHSTYVPYNINFPVPRWVPRYLFT